MPAQARRVIILYSHPLLGEGLAHLLGAAPELQVELVRVDDEGEAERALAASPDVVIVERSGALRAIDVLQFAPSALLIDVGLDAGPAWAYRREELSSRPDELIRTIRALGHRGPRGRLRPLAPVPVDAPALETLGRR